MPYKFLLYFVQNIDLGALTGWVPERVSLKSEEVNKERLFDRMLEGLHRGGCFMFTTRGGLALLFWGGVVALKGSVERGQTLNGCGHLDNFSLFTTIILVVLFIISRHL